MSNFVARPDSVFLFSPKHITESSPDFRGDVTLSAQLVESIARKHAAREPVKLQISLWKKSGASGVYMSGGIRENNWLPRPPEPVKKPVDDIEVPF